MIIYVYSLTCYPDLIKVGQTKRNAEKRIKEQVSILPVINGVKPYKILYEIDDKELGVNITDREIHKALKQYHVSGEWFNCTLDQFQEALYSIAYDKLISEYTYIENKKCKQYIKKDKTKIIYKDKEYKSTCHLCKVLNISYNTLYADTHKGLTLEQAIEKQLNKPKIIYKNKEYKSVTHLCRELNIPYQLLYQNISKYPTLEQAIKRTLEPTTAKEDKQRVVYKDKEYKSVAHLCRELKLPYNTILARVFNGMALEQAIETPIKQHTTTRVYTLKLNNKTYTKRDLEKEFHICHKTIDKYLNKGYSINEIINMKLNKNGEGKR